MILRFLKLGLSALIVVGLAACASDPDAIKQGSRVQIHYSLDADGKTVIPFENPETMELVVGEGAYPLKYESALIGMREGDKKVVALKPKEGYGLIEQSLLVRVPRENLPSDITEGMVIGSKDPNGRLVSMRVVKILDDGTVVLDKNHPLAGKSLIYRIEIMDVV